MYNQAYWNKSLEDAKTRGHTQPSRNSCMHFEIRFRQPDDNDSCKHVLQNQGTHAKPKRDTCRNKGARIQKDAQTQIQGKMHKIKGMLENQVESCKARGTDPTKGIEEMERQWQTRKKGGYMQNQQDTTTKECEIKKKICKPKKTRRNYKVGTQKQKVFI